MKLLTKADAAALLGVHTRTIENLIASGKLPRAKKIGRRVYWLKDEFEAHLKKALSLHDESADDDASSPSTPPAKRRP